MRMGTTDGFKGEGKETRKRGAKPFPASQRRWQSNGGNEMERSNAIYHLQFIRLWASLALADPNFTLTDGMYKNIKTWTHELIEWLKEDEHDHR